jgi:hypothetical protein
MGATVDSNPASVQDAAGNRIYYRAALGWGRRARVFEAARPRDAAGTQGVYNDPAFDTALLTEGILRWEGPDADPPWTPALLDDLDPASPMVALLGQVLVALLRAFFPPKDADPNAAPPSSTSSKPATTA